MSVALREVFARTRSAGLPELVLGTIAVQGLSFGVQLAIAKILSPAEFGTARAVEAALATALQLAYCGMPSLMIRHVAEVESWHARQMVVRRLTGLAAMSGAIVAVAVMLLAPWLVPANAVSLLRVLACTLVFTSGGRTLVNYFYGLRDPRRAAWITVPLAAVSATLILLSAHVWSLQGWALARVGAEALFALTLAVYITRDGRGANATDRAPAPYHDARLTTAALVTIGLPLSVSLLLRTAIDNMPVLAFARMGGDKAALPALGLSTLVATVLLIVPAGAITLALPRMVARAGQPSELRAFFYRTARLVALATILPIIPAVTLLPFVVHRVLPGYEHGLVAASIVLLVVPLRALSSLSGTLLLTVDRSTDGVYATAVVLVVNVALQVALIPLWGVAGAVTATVVGEILSLAMLFAVVQYRLRRLPELTPAVSGA